MIDVRTSADRPARRPDPRGISRRAVTTAAAWTVPVVAVAVGTPAAAASGLDVGAFVLNGTCGSPGILGPGFTLTAGSADLPVGTTITIVGSGVANIGVFTATPSIATITSPSSTTRFVTLTGPLLAGSTLGLRTTLSVTSAFTLNATTTLPEGSVGTGAKSTASVRSDRVFCTGN
ncbi:hypothetical protein MT355_15750 [Rathayibacter sp. VKM Ac-2929]|uniref:hypothetical protein n=1 Tax=Rathayibacter sp. VKM Ac-2929 TaxID=2929480 RepID=UPI001FB31B2A|nr:hypothetical protein [Rathayibacter sp. VKM Ac-2929]MCJ1674713.1 hypothetical protein [Rathayibacter sp. VKM Ac-2929]